MAGFVQNILWNSVSGFVDNAKRTAGEYGGNALIKAGDVIENGGRGVGNTIEKKATNYGSSLSGQAYTPSPKALPSTARKPVVKRSNSTPASNKPTTSGTKVVGSTPLGANKYPGRNQVNGATGAAKKVVGGGVTGVRSTAGSVTGSASKVTGGVVGGAPKVAGGIVGGASKVTGGVVGGASKVTGGVVGGAQRAIPPFKGAPSVPAPNKALPKPYPQNGGGLPKPYSGNAFPSSGNKTVVKPGLPKPFVPPVEQKKNEKKPYPGTNTLPGQGSNVPVQQQKYKPLPRLGPQVGAGQKVQHISV